MDNKNNNKLSESIDTVPRKDPTSPNYPPTDDLASNPRLPGTRLYEFFSTPWCCFLIGITVRGFFLILVLTRKIEINIGGGSKPPGGNGPSSKWRFFARNSSIYSKRSSDEGSEKHAEKKDQDTNGGVSVGPSDKSKEGLKGGFFFFQDSVSPNRELILVFHDWLILFLFPIIVGTLCSIFIVRGSTYLQRSYKDSQVVELLWTVFPSLVLIAIGIPSLRLLYLVDETGRTGITVKALGHQWYWEYDYPEYPTIDSYLIKREYRLLDTDNRLFLPLGQVVQMLVSSADVLHSWTLPTISVKGDAIPGRVNKLSLELKRSGVYFGQCSEICGRNHRFIPISMECDI